MLDWATISSLATAGGTLVLAVATFSSVRSANRAARAAERSLLAGLRPLLMPSRLQDPPQKIVFGDEHWVVVAGGHAALESNEEAVYLTVVLRNAGSGIAVLHGWCFRSEEVAGGDHHADLDQFRLQTRDMYVPAGDVGFWQGAFRDPGEDAFAVAQKVVEGRLTATVELLYGDHEGGQRTISRFRILPADDGTWLASVTRHWSLDHPGPR